jgi:hypothetical protein
MALGVSSSLVDFLQPCKTHFMKLLQSPHSSLCIGLVDNKHKLFYNLCVYIISSVNIELYFKVSMMFHWVGLNYLCHLSPWWSTFKFVFSFSLLRKPSQIWV